MTILRECDPANSSLPYRQDREPASMSRIFEALTRSEEERSGISFPVPPALATELLQRAEQASMGVVAAAASAPATSERPEIGEAGSIPITVFPGSRLVCLSDQE